MAPSWCETLTLGSLEVWSQGGMELWHQGGLELLHMIVYNCGAMVIGDCCISMALWRHAAVNNFILFRDGKSYISRKSIAIFSNRLFNIDRALFYV